MALRDVRAREIDAVLHRERLDRGKKRLHPLPVPVEQLPDGAMVQAGEESFLIVQGRALRWSLAGYRKADGAHRECDAADAAIDVARAGRGISAGAASECGGALRRVSTACLSTPSLTACAAASRITGNPRSVSAVRGRWIARLARLRLAMTSR